MFEGLKSARLSVRTCLTVVALGAFAAGATGCGEDSSEPESGASGQQASAATGDNVAKARELTELASTSLLHGPGTGPVDVDKLRAPEAGDIKPISFKPGGPTKTVGIVSCAPTGTCAHMAEMANKFLTKMGIRSRVFHADYTPAGNQRAVDNAIGIKPDALYMLAIQPVTVSQQLARAKAAGIKTVNGTGTQRLNKGDLDGHVGQSSNLFQALSALKLIADSDGDAKLKWLVAPEFPELEERAGIDVMKELCPGCEVSEGTETAAQVTSPVLMGQLIASTLRKDPDLDYIQLASACADLGAAAAAARNGSETVVTAPGCGASAIAAMNAGNLPFVVGAVESWGVLQGIDQILRLLAGEQPIPEEQTGPGVYLLTPENTPDKTSNATYGPLERWAVEKFDFVAPYSEAWGVDLGSVIADAK